ncbi:MAG: flotillin family protein [Fimbriimonadaceae bacterium]
MIATLQAIQGISPQMVIGVAAGALVAIFLVVAFIKSFLYLCPPNFVLIFYGRGREPRKLFGGRGIKVPIFEQVAWMSLSTLEVPISVRNAYSQGGVALNVDAIANVKISSDPKIINNAIERFLGRDPNEIRRVAKETLEGHLRGVLARLTPEEVNEDRLKFADELSRESELDLNKLGIHLDTLKIQHVSDETHYLDSIGREAIANVIKDAEMSESDARREAELAEAGNQGRANVARANAEAAIAKMKNELRREQADLDSQVKSEEERTLAAAREARAKAEQELQRARAELETLRLQVDTVLPAEAHRVAEQNRARGAAAIVRERGVAISQAVEEMNAAWRAAGDNALSITLIEDIEKIIARAAEGVSKVQIQSLNMIDGGDGKVLSNYISAYPAMLKSIFEAVNETTGIDIPKAISTTRSTEAQEDTK